MNNIISLIKRYGFVGIAENLLFKSFRLYGFYDFQIMRLLYFDLRKNRIQRENNIQIQRLYFEDFLRCKHNDQIRLNESVINQLKERFDTDEDRGEICYGITEDDFLVAYSWISLKYYPRSTIKLRENAAFIYDDYTHPKFRGKGLHKELIRHRLHVLTNMNYHDVYASVDLFNKASLKGFLKEHFEKCNCYRMWKDKTGTVKTTFKI